jgi:thioesterase domain-containing protein/acyl carrier protein
VDRARLPPATQQAPAAPPADQWEIVVADLWSEVLGLENIGRDDDFMALGGDSLSAEEMLQSVQDRFGVALVSSDLVEASTLQAFTRRVTMGSAILPTHPDVVPLQTGHQHRPIFCFAGSGALALSFLPLSRHLQGRSVYAFQAHGLERRGFPDWSVEAAAERFLELLRLIQPAGPYVLLGHSFGGLVALETARRLVAAGEQVELLGLLDTYLPRSAGQQPTYVYETLTEKKDEHHGSFRRGLKGVQQRLLPDGLPVLQEWGRHARAYAAGLVPFSGQRQFDAFFDHGNLAMRRYRPEPYRGRTLVVLADGNPDSPESWDPVLTGDRRILELPAEHSSLLREPWAAELGAVLEDELGQRP